MTELTAGVSTLAPDAVVVSPRDLTLVERDDLDRLRAELTRTINRSDPRALSWLWDRNVTDLGGRPAPAGLVEAVGAALGDVLVATVPGTRWVVCPGPEGAMPAVVAAARPGAPVMPFADAWDRWEACSRSWVIPYLSRAAAHLALGVMPQQRGPQEAPSDEVAPEPVAAEPAAEAAVFVPVVEAPVVEVPAFAAAPEPIVEPVPVPIEPAAFVPVVEAPAFVPAEPAAFVPVVEAPAFAAAPIPGPAPVAGVVVEALPAPHLVPSAEPSDAVRDLALVALDHALSALRLGPFDREAFVTTVDASGMRTLACQDEPAVALRRAREMARTSGAQRVAIGWIDRRPTGVPGPLQAFPAVLVEASEAGVAGLRVAHRFVDDVLGTGPLGDPQIVGRVPALL